MNNFETIIASKVGNAERIYAVVDATNQSKDIFDSERKAKIYKNQLDKIECDRFSEIWKRNNDVYNIEDFKSQLDIFTVLLNKEKMIDADMILVKGIEEWTNDPEICLPGHIFFRPNEEWKLSDTDYKTYLAGSLYDEWLAKNPFPNDPIEHGLWLFRCYEAECIFSYMECPFNVQAQKWKIEEVVMNRAEHVSIYDAVSDYVELKLSHPSLPKPVLISLADYR